MPSSSYPISGVIKDIDNSTLLSGVTVTAYNDTTDEEISITSTTNSVGEYSLDLANLVSGYSNGDYVVLKATSGDKIQQYGFTVTSTGYEEHNLVMTYQDVLSLIKGLLDTYWRAGHCDLKTPTIAKVFDVKRLELNTQGNKNYIVLYERPSIPKENALGGLSKELTCKCVIDIRGMDNRETTIKIRNEVDRILGYKIINPCYGWDILHPDYEWTDLSDKSRFLWRYTMSVDAVKLNSLRQSEWVKA